MVQDPGASLGAHGLRTLGLPRPVEVALDEHAQPARVWLSSGGFAVVAIDERWRINEHWWRETPLERTYYRLVLEDGRGVDLFIDDRTGEWFEQRYPGTGQ